MSLYPDSPYPLAEDIDVLHRDELESFARAGTWGTARESTAIAAEARRARYAAGIKESVGDEALTTSARLPEVVRELARRVALGGVTVDYAFCADVLSQGVSEGAYVEIVGVVARLAHLDVFARGIGVPARVLQDPDDSTSPSFERPAQARDEGFFVTSLPSAPEGGALVESIFGKAPAPDILRSLSLVPDEVRRLNRFMNREYFSLESNFKLTCNSLESLDRPQIELVAARVSALNQRFY